MYPFVQLQGIKPTSHLLSPMYSTSGIMWKLDLLPELHITAAIPPRDRGFSCIGRLIAGRKKKSPLESSVLSMWLLHLHFRADIYSHPNEEELHRTERNNLSAFLQILKSFMVH